MTLLEIVEAYLLVGVAVALIELEFFFPWQLVIPEAKKYLGHLDLSDGALVGLAVVGVVFALACTVVTWPKSVYDLCKKKTGENP